MSAYSSKFIKEDTFKVLEPKRKSRLAIKVSFSTPEVIRGINAFYLGATSVNPKFDLDIVWLMYTIQ